MKYTNRIDISVALYTWLQVAGLTLKLLLSFIDRLQFGQWQHYFLKHVCIATRTSRHVDRMPCNDCIVHSCVELCWYYTCNPEWSLLHLRLDWVKSRWVPTYFCGWSIVASRDPLRANKNWGSTAQEHFTVTELHITDEWTASRAEHSGKTKAGLGGGKAFTELDKLEAGERSFNLKPQPNVFWGHIF